MPPMYYAVRETPDYGAVTLHADRDCPDGPVRAAPGSLDGAECPDCLAEEPETCQEVKGDGEVCGRDLPCQYHS